MARDRVPVLKRCRSLGLDPIYLGIEKKSKKELLHTILGTVVVAIGGIMIGFTK